MKIVSIVLIVVGSIAITLGVIAGYIVVSGDYFPAYAGKENIGMLLSSFVGGMWMGGGGIFFWPGLAAVVFGLWLNLRRK